MSLFIPLLLALSSYNPDWTQGVMIEAAALKLLGEVVYENDLKVCYASNRRSYECVLKKATV